MLFQTGGMFYSRRFRRQHGGSRNGAFLVLRYGRRGRPALGGAIQRIQRTGFPLCRSLAFIFANENYEKPAPFKICRFPAVLFPVFLHRANNTSHDMV